jgi:Subtilase family
VRKRLVVGLLAAIAAGGGNTGSARAFDPLPMKLPPQGARAAAQPAPDTWLLGIEPAERAQRLAARHGARRVTDGAVVIASARARVAAAALRRAGLLRYAEPDVTRRQASSFDGHPEQWARVALVPPALAAPPATGASIGVIDDRVDRAHPDVAGHTTFVEDDGLPPAGEHGTMVASIAAGAAGNGGVMGMFPGAPLLSYATDLTCGDIAHGVDALSDAGAGVINLSLGGTDACVTEYVAIERAIGTGSVVVAAAGNEFQAGNPVMYPAAFPHVLSVASVGPDYASSEFSNANSAIDISAPGEGVPAAIPLAFDVYDGLQDGVTLADGTSFAAPMVAGAAAWLQAARPGLSALQVADTLRIGATDIGPDGWDRDTGWGLASIPGALSVADPVVDPLEPNDDMPFVNGTYFAGADRPIFTGSGTRRLRASVDFAEDPYDVYRIRMPGRSSLKATLRPSYGDPDLFAYHGRARHIGHESAIVARSERVSGPDRVRLVNRGRRRAAGYLVVRAASSEGTIDSRYTLTVVRTRYRR